MVAQMAGAVVAVHQGLVVAWVAQTEVAAVTGGCGQWRRWLSKQQPGSEPGLQSSGRSTASQAWALGSAACSGRSSTDTKALMPLGPEESLYPGQLQLRVPGG